MSYRPPSPSDQAFFAGFPPDIAQKVVLPAYRAGLAARRAEQDLKKSPVKFRKGIAGAVAYERDCGRISASTADFILDLLGAKG